MKKAPLLCRILGHRFRLRPSFYTIGMEATEYCIRKGCDAKRDIIFDIERF